MKKRSIGALAAAGVVALSLAACSGGAGGTAAAGSSSGPLPTVKMMVGGIDKQIYLPYQLAQQLGYYKKYGVNMELSTEQNGGVGAEDAMASGQVDLAGAWYIHTVDFQSKGKDVINLVQLSGAPGERVMCNPKAGVSSAADFKGKNMGVTDLGSGTDELTQFLAAKQGVTKKEYNTIAVHAAVGAAHDALARCARELHDVDDVLALRLEVDGVDVPGTGEVDLARGHRVLGADAAVLLGGELDVDAVLLVEAEALGELVGQVDLLVDTADHDLDRRHRRGAAAAGRVRVA